MTLNLSDNIFTEESDIFPIDQVAQISNVGLSNTLAGNDSISGSGLYGIINRGTILTQEGRDTLQGLGITRSGIANFQGIINTGSGNDLLVGITSAARPNFIRNESDFFNFVSVGGDRAGIFNKKSSVLTGFGQDRIFGSGFIGILNQDGEIRSGAGSDTLEGLGGAIGIQNSGFIDTGRANDEILASGSIIGLNNEGRILTGEGDDSITGIATEDDNELSLTFSVPVGILIDFGGRLDDFTLSTGTGDDSISGVGIGDEGIGIQIWDFDRFFEFEQSINTGAGDDLISATGSRIGLFQEIGMIDTGSGNDVIIGTLIPGLDNGLAGIYATEDSITLTGNGHDSIFGSGNIGIKIAFFSFFDTGDGNDTIEGYSNEYDGLSLTDDAILSSGRGNDSITGVGVEFGINNYIYSLIDTGNGNDSITGTGDIGIRNTEDSEIETGLGRDIVHGIGNKIGISNDRGSLINTGASNDTIIGESSDGQSGIENFGEIITAFGNDIIDARQGGFSGDGVARLGAGNDLVIGFGSGQFLGGRGQDTLELTSGEYLVSLRGNTIRFTSQGVTMTTSGFEALDIGSQLLDFANLSAGQMIVVDNEAIIG